MAPKPRVKGAASGAKNSKSLFSSGFLTSGLTLGATAFSVASMSGALKSLGIPGLPSLEDILSNPVYLGAAAVGLFVLLK